MNGARIYFIILYENTKTKKKKCSNRCVSVRVVRERQMYEKNEKKKKKRLHNELGWDTIFERLYQAKPIIVHIKRTKKPKHFQITTNNSKTRRNISQTIPRA